MSSQPPVPPSGRYVMAGAVNTWYDVEGEGEAVLLLHGALSDSSSFFATKPALTPLFSVLTPERRGHGHTADLEGPITYDLMADDTVAFIEEAVGGPAHLVGHSDGAIVALLVALRRPDLVRKLVLISGNFHHDGIPAETLAVIDDLATMDLMADIYGAVSPDGRGHFPVVVEKIERMIRAEPTLTTDDLHQVAARTLVMAGDDDAIAPEHTQALYENIPDAELAVVPGTSHTLILEKPDLCNRIIVDFLVNPPVATLMPLRRA
jgi:pimeloyl-ACP methyl ester carboxylesterase